VHAAVERPVVAPYVPAGHDVGAEEAAGQYLPKGHVVQPTPPPDERERPVAAPYEPAGHAVPVKATAAKDAAVCETLTVYAEPAVTIAVMVVPGTTVPPVTTMPTAGVPVAVPAHVSAVPEMDAVAAVAAPVPEGQ